ncbi:unnamed protein product [Schistocephalus solidus]|uniref:TMEM105 n=1 Tax=Schistocephalus solidus TaxID=70667 RepID=A0A183SXU5_SCHSO|nr:unnamed protein product [Schistocephalus solidus]
MDGNSHPAPTPGPPPRRQGPSASPPPCPDFLPACEPGPPVILPAGRWDPELAHARTHTRTYEGFELPNQRTLLLFQATCTGIPSSSLSLD